MAPVNRHPLASEWLRRGQYCPKRCFSDSVFTWLLSLKDSSSWENCFCWTVDIVVFFQATQTFKFSYVSVCLLWTLHIPSYISQAATLERECVWLPFNNKDTKVWSFETVAMFTRLRMDRPRSKVTMTNWRCSRTPEQPSASWVMDTGVILVKCRRSLAFLIRKQVIFFLTIKNTSDGLV